MSWAAVYGTKMFGLVVPWLYLLFGIKAVYADLFELLKYFLPFYIWHAFTMTWISRGRSLAIMTDVSQYIAAPAVLKAVITGLVRPKGHKFKVTAKGGDRNQRFVEWPLLRLYGSALLITLLGDRLRFHYQSAGREHCLRRTGACLEFVQLRRACDRVLHLYRAASPPEGRAI